MGNEHKGESGLPQYRARSSNSAGVGVNPSDPERDFLLIVDSSRAHPHGPSNAYTSDPERVYDPRTVFFRGSEF